MSGKKGRAVARQSVKNLRRVERRRGKVPRWMKGQPVLKKGMGGTDKSGTVKPSPVYYSQANAERMRGHPSAWEGLPFRDK